MRQHLVKNWKNRQVVLDGISGNMATMLQTDKYGAINTTMKLQWGNIWMNSCQNPTYYKKKQGVMEN